MRTRGSRLVEEQSSDDELVGLARAGDKASFGELLERYWPMVVTLCTRLAKRPDVAADAAQEAAIEALVNLDRLRNPARFGPWWAGIALNVTRRWLRDESRSRALVDGRELVDPALGPEDVVVRAELADCVRDAVAALPAGQREAIRLYYFEERSGLEVAEAAETTEGAVKTRLAKARDRLSRQLAGPLEVHKMPSRLEFVPMSVVDARREATEQGELRRHVIVLREVGGDRELPIFVGPFEGMAAAVHLEGISLPRPMTYALAQSLIKSLGARLTEVRITRLLDQTFYAEIEVEGPGGIARLDARPSDGINLALLCDAAITVDSQVLQESAAACRDWPSEAFTDGAAEIAADALALTAWRPPPPDDEGSR
jgi:RNA polymerase sigma factor (sigma-70 family)